MSDINDTKEQRYEPPSSDIINWDNPAERFRLAETVGTEEYNRLFEEHFKQSIVCSVNGYGIRPVNSRFGRLFAIVGTTRAFSDLEEAKAYAASLPAGGKA